MFDELKISLSMDKPGFSGINHILTTIMIFLILLLIPIEPFSSFLRTILTNPLIGIIAFFIIVGSCLLPDGDNLKADGGSMVIWQLGFIGSILSTIMVTISSIATSLFKTKKDNLPPTQHRMLFHTWIIPLLLFCLIYFFAQSGDTLVKDAPGLIGNIAIIICILLILFVGIACLLKKLPMIRNNTAQIIAVLGSLLGIGYIWFFCDLYTLKLLLYCIALGYGCHLLGDMFADTGVPMFPVCFIWSGAFWKRFCFLGPLSVKTGSTTESLLKFVFLGIDIVLFMIVFFGVGVFGDIGATIESIS